MSLSISVISPTYRREEPLQESLEDVLKQDYPDLEILVIDQIIPTISSRKQYFETKDDFGRTFMHLAAISG